MPSLRALVQRHSDDPFVLLGVNTGDSEEAFRRESEKMEVTWPCVFQGNGSPIADLYRVRGYPTIHVIDAEGRLRYLNVRGEAIEKAVERLLAELKDR